MKKLGVIFGGMSTENDVSLVSANSVLKNLNKDKYEIYPIYIDKKGEWYKYLDDYNKTTYDGIVEKKEKILNIIEYLKKLDIIFPVLHGLYGEDGTMQGLFELLKIPYIGCKVLSSSIGMDKAYSKIIFEKAKLNISKYQYIRKYNDKYIYVDKNFNETVYLLDEAVEKIVEQQKFPMFVKPSNSGSSVGISKVHNIEELKEGIKNAEKYDVKILIEEGIIGKEVECAVLGNEDVIASNVGQILSGDEFYSYDAKYLSNSSKTLIPADLSKQKIEEINEQIKEKLLELKEKNVTNDNSAYVSGITGTYQSCTIKNCYNTGKISMDSKKNESNEQRIAGIASIGNNIENCYNLGEIKVTTNSTLISIGGIEAVAYIESIKNSCNSGKIQIESEANVEKIGAIIGDNTYGGAPSALNNCIWQKGSYSKGIGLGSGDALEVEEKNMPSVLSIINKENSFKEDTNNINNGYPILNWQ